jgi:hypothetical protein
LRQEGPSKLIWFVAMKGLSLEVAKFNGMPNSRSWLQLYILKCPEIAGTSLHSMSMLSGRIALFDTAAACAFAPCESITDPDTI